MAQRVTVALEDDLDGGPADETVRFGFGGAEYEIDLSNKNARAFRNQLGPSSITPARQDGTASPLGSYSGKPPAHRRYPGLGEGPRHRVQRTRAYPGQLDREVRNRYQKTLTQRAPSADSARVVSLPSGWLAAP